MIIFLYGKDTFRLKEKLKEFVEGYKKSFGKKASLEILDFSKDNFQDFILKINSSLFQERKILNLREIFDLKEDQKKDFIKRADFFSKKGFIFLISQEKEFSLTDPLFLFLKKRAKIYKFPKLEGKKLEKWIKKRFEKRKIKITKKAIQTLLEFLGDDMWALSNEIEKLSNLKEKGKILQKDIKLYVKPKIALNIFETIDELAKQNRAQALFLLKKHLEKGENPLYLFSMINFQFRNLLILKDLLEKGKSYDFILKEVPLHPLIIKKSFFQAKNFSFLKLKKIYQKIFQLDFQIKIGKIKPELALELLVANFIH